MNRARIATPSTFSPWTLEELAAYYAVCNGRVYKPVLHAPLAPVGDIGRSTESTYEPPAPPDVTFPQTADYNFTETAPNMYRHSSAAPGIEWTRGKVVWWTIWLAVGCGIWYGIYLVAKMLFGR